MKIIPSDDISMPLAVNFWDNLTSNTGSLDYEIVDGELLLHIFVHLSSKANVISAYLSNLSIFISIVT